MIVYGDILFVENFITGAALIYISSMIFGESFDSVRKKGRLAIGGFMCGAFSLTVFLPLKGAVIMALEAAFAILVCLEVFGRDRVLLRALSLVLTTCFAGGMIMALLLASGSRGIYTAAGIYTGEMKASLLAVFFCLAAVTMRQIIKTVSRKKFQKEHFVIAVIRQGEKSIETRAFLDTGNDLREPVSGRPVAIACRALWSQMEEGEFIKEERMALVPYDSLGRKGIIQAVRVDDIVTEGKAVGSCFIGKGETVADFGGRGSEEFQLLLSRYMADVKL